jgi:hypothetical protein
MTTEKTSNWTPEQEAIIATLMRPKAEGGCGMTRSNAVRKMRQTEAKANAPVSPAKAKAVVHKLVDKAVKEIKARAKKEPKVAEPKFDTKPVNKGDAFFVESNDRGKFDKQLMVNLFVDGGLTLRAVATKVKCSPVYAHRVIIGVEKDAGGQGVDKGHHARRKEAAARAAAAKAADKK